MSISYSRRVAAITLAPLVFVAACAARPSPVLPVAAPAWPRARVTLVVDTVDGLGLFLDETAEANARLASWAAREVVKVVDPSLQRQVLERARSGRDAQTGASCGLPIARWAARERWSEVLGANGILRARVMCDYEKKTCTLGVEADTGPQFEGDVLFELTAPFDPRAPWRKELPRSLAALAPIHDDASGMGGLGLLENGVEPVHAHPEHLGVWAYPARAIDGTSSLDGTPFFAKGTGPLRECVPGLEGLELLVDVDARGVVSRCEAREADDAAARCACDAFKEHALASDAARGKRLYVGVDHQPAEVATPTNAVVRASVRTHIESYTNLQGQTVWRPLVSDRAIADWKPPTVDRISACFATSPARGDKELHLLVRVTFDGAGHAVAADLARAGDALVTEEAVACVKNAFLRSVAPCPRATGATATAELSLFVLTLAAPAP